jgi:two-component system NtrC family sensor kinase
MLLHRSDMVEGLEVDRSPAGAKFRDSLLGALASTHSLREAFDRFTVALNQAVRLDQCSLARFLPESRLKILQVHSNYSGGEPRRGTILHLNREQAGCLLGGMPVEMGPEVASGLLAEGMRSGLIMPVFFRGELLGGVLMETRRPHGFRETDFGPARAVAQVLGTVMANEGLAESLQEIVTRRTTELEDGLRDAETLLTISGLLLEPRDPRPALEAVAATLAERLGRGGSCEIFLWDAANRHLVLEASTAQGRPVTPTVLPATHKLAEAAAQELEAFRVREAQRDARFERRFPATRSALVAPVRCGETLFGIVCLENPEPDAFGYREQALLNSVTRQVAFWMDNRRLQAQRERAEAETKAASESLARANAELRQTLHELQASRDRLVQVEKLAAVGTLVAGAAHELNNPLAVMQGYSEILLSQPLSTGIRQRVEAILDQARRASEIVSGLLQLARVSPAARTQLEAESWEAPAPAPATCNLADTLHEALAAHAGKLVEHNIHLRIDTDPALFAAIEAEDLSLVIGHLLQNAVYAMQECERREIEIRLARRDDQAELSVADSGTGISAEHLPQVFDPFFTTKPVGAGAGLGLSICFGVITARGGHMTAANRPEGGAIFTVTLPVLPDAQHPAASNGSALVVAQDESARFLWQEALSGEQWHVVEVASPEEAIERLQATSDAPFDVVLADLRCPQREAIWLHEEMGRRDLLVPLVVVIGEMLDPLEQDTLRQTGCPLLNKPFRLKDLRAVLDPILASRPH